MNDANLDTGKVFEKIFEVYRAQFAVFVPAALIIFIPIALLSGLVVSSGGVGLALLAGVISVVGSFWLQGVIVEAVRDIQDGRRDLSIGGLFSSVTPVLGALIVAGILAAIGIGIGFILLIVPGLILLTYWALLAPVIVIERPGIGAAFGRSMELVRGNGFRVFGIIVVLFIVQAILNAILRAIFGGDSFAGAAIASLLSSSLVAPLSGIAAAVVYLELRRLKGDAPVPAGADPTAPAEATPAAPPTTTAPPTTPQEPTDPPPPPPPAPPAV